MVEKEIQREREVETPALTHYDKSSQELREMNRKAKEGKKVLKSKSIPYEVNRQGVVKNYFKGDLTDICNDRWTIFCHEIRQHSGKHLHQGGINLFVIKGEGYTTVDGKRYNWKEGDLILLPIKKGGVVHQHFNTDGQPSKWVAFRHRTTSDGVGAFREQKETFSMWKEKGQDK